MSHTPGPWKIDAAGLDRITGGEVIKTADGQWIASVHDFNRYDRDAERQANARLIAEAPEVLAQLQLVYGYWQSMRRQLGDPQARIPAVEELVARVNGQAETTQAGDLDCPYCQTLHGPCPEHGGQGPRIEESTRRHQDDPRAS